MIHDDGNSWRINKVIPVPFIVALAAQSLVFVWYFGSQTTRLEMKLDQTSEQIRELKVDRYSKEDGRRDQQLMLQMLEALKEQDRDNERRISQIEIRHQDLERGRLRATR